jgi:hypothetical protein
MANLYNPGFEQGDTGWNKQDVWQIVQSPPSPFGIRPGSVGTWQAWHGAHPSVPTSAITNNARFLCAPGQLVSASAWVYQSTPQSSGGGAAGCRINFIDSNNNYIATFDGNYQTVAGWMQSFVSGIAPSNAAYFVVDIALFNQTAGGTQVDDVTVSGAYDAITLLPDSSGYSGANSSPVVSTKLDGGAPRIRATQLGAVSQVNVQWTTDSPNFEYLQALYRANGYGAKRILAKLILDTSQPQFYVVTVEPGSWRLISQQGQTYVLGATLNVVPNPPNPAYDQSIVDMFALGNPLNLLSALGTFVNTTLSSNL